MKKPTFEVDDPKAAFKRFEDLTRLLLTVPKAELTTKMVEYERQKVRKHKQQKAHHRPFKHKR